jgi:GTPase SAR1 family protein
VTLSINETPCKFDIMDTAGQDPYSTTHKLPHEEQIRAALENNVLIIVYDIILISSFIIIPLLFSLDKYLSRIITILISNNIDKEKQR